MISCYFIGPKPSKILYFPPSKQGDEILIILEFELMSFFSFFFSSTHITYYIEPIQCIFPQYSLRLDPALIKNKVKRGTHSSNFIDPSLQIKLIFILIWTLVFVIVF